MSNGICYVVGAGGFYDHRIRPNTKDLVIAADGGYQYLQEQKIRIDLLVGDFDSLDTKPDFENILEFPSDKEDTDMLLAIKEGLSQGYRRFFIYGGTGDRIDHTIANIQLLSFLAKNKAIGYLFGEKNIITAITNKGLSFAADKKGSISILSHSSVSNGVTIKGLKYEVSDVEFTNDYPLGVSNEFLGTPSTISVKDGTLLIAWERRANE